MTQVVEQCLNILMPPDQGQPGQQDEGACIKITLKGVEWVLNRKISMQEILPAGTPETTLDGYTAPTTGRHQRLWLVKS